MLAPFPPDSALDETACAARTEFVSLAAAYGDDLPLDQAFAWLCAEERGEAKIDGLIATLDEIAAGIFLPMDIDDIEAVARINHHLFETLGFSGARDNYDDPEHSLLDTLLTTKKGLPISLSILYMEVARRKGLSIRGIGFPTHFVVSPAESTPRFFLDPFNKGQILRHAHMDTWFKRIHDKSGGRLPPLSWWLKPINHRQILVRVNNNLKASHMRRNDLSAALRCVERLLILTPDALDLRRDRGLLRLELGLEEEGAKDLDAYLAVRHERPLTD